MSNEPKPTKPHAPPADLLTVGAVAALKRARKRAEEIAIATDTALVQWRDGKIVHIYPGRKGQLALVISTRKISASQPASGEDQEGLNL